METEPFDTPTVVQVDPEGDTWTGRALSAVQPVIQPAVQAWQAADARRSEARSEETRAALIEANRAHRDAMRDLRRDRKAFEKARDEVKWWNVFNGERRAARIVVRDSRELARDARSARREARNAYPLTMPALALRCHAAHLVPSSVWAAVSDSVAAGAALSTGLAAVAINVAVAVVARRNAATGVADPELEALRPSQYERDLLQRLDGKMWYRVAEPRGLDGVLATGATLTASGIQAKLTLNGSWDLDALRKKEAQLRAALRLKEETRLELREGKTGGHARLTLRTRSAADGVELEGWTAGSPWGVNTVTGETFPVQLGRRLLIAGISGSGKSWSARSILAEASERDDHCLVVLDMKRIEARLWRKRARIAITPAEIQEVLAELVAEMYDRLDLIPDGHDVVQISPSLPRITVFVDEGSELIAASKKEYASILEDARTLARMGRAAEIQVLWATQKPMLSGDSPGLDTQIAAQITCRVSMAVSTQKEAMVVFGDDAISEGWIAHKLPMPGVAMIRDSNQALPHHLKMRAMSPKNVMALPERPIWSRRSSWTGATEADIKVRVDMEKAIDPWAGKDTGVTPPGGTSLRKPRVSAADRDDQILNELAKDPCQKLSELAKRTGASKSVVKSSLERMEADGLVRRDDEGCWWPSHN